LLWLFAVLKDAKKAELKVDQKAGQKDAKKAELKVGLRRGLRMPAT